MCVQNLNPMCSVCQEAGSPGICPLFAGTRASEEGQAGEGRGVCARVSARSTDNPAPTPQAAELRPVSRGMPVASAPKGLPSSKADSPQWQPLPGPTPGAGRTHHFQQLSLRLSTWLTADVFPSVARCVSRSSERPALRTLTPNPGIPLRMQEAWAQPRSCGSQACPFGAPPRLPPPVAQGPRTLPSLPE